MLISHFRIGKPSTSGGSSLDVSVSRLVARLQSTVRDDLRDSLRGNKLNGAFDLIAVSGPLALERHGVESECCGRLEMVWKWFCC